MKKLTIALFVFLVFSLTTHAQTSVVTATITDSDNQTWNNGSYTISFIQSSGNSAPPVWNGSPLDSAHKLFKGVMSPSGVLTVSIPDSTFITPSGSSWLFVLCPYSSGSCSQVQTPVVGPSVDLSATLSGGITAPRFPAVAGAYGYLDVEVTPIPPPGGFYFNVTSNLQRIWTGSSWQNGGGGGGGGSVGPGSVNSIPCFLTTTSIGNCIDNITDIAGVVTIPTTTQVGGGAGAASIAMTSGATSGCQTPTTGVNILCSDGVNNTFDASLNGGPYVPFGTGAPVYNIKSYGAICDQAHIAADTAAINAAFAAALPTGGTIFFPTGFCQYDNSTSGKTITSAVGITIAGDGKGSILLFNTLANVGFFFTAANGLTIRDMYFQFQPTRTTRGGNGYPVSIDSSSNVILSNLYFNNGNLSGLRIGNSTTVRTTNVELANFEANGIFAPNDVDLKFVNTTCINVNDGCEEYSYFDSGTQAACERITSTGMTALNTTGGYIINGCKNVTISNGNIIGAGLSAMKNIQDPSTTTKQFPDQVAVGNITIRDTGYGTNALNSTAAVAININVTGTPATNQRIILHDIHIVHTAQRAIFLSDHNTINLSANNIWIDDNGAAQVTGSGEAIALEGGNIVNLSNITSSAANRYALRDDLASIVNVTNFTSINAQVGNTSAAAIRKTSTGSLVMNGVNMIDTYAGSNRAQIQNSDTTGAQFLVTNITSSCTVKPCGVVTGSVSSNSLQPPYSGFGSLVSYSSAACETAFGATTLSGATTTTGLNCLPANAIIDAVVYRVTTTITTATSFTIGDSGSATRYCGTKSGLTAGTTGTCTAQGYYLNATAAGVLITPSTTPGAGAIRLLVYYHTWTAPTT